VRAATIVDGRIEVRSHPDPTPGTGQLLVRVRSAGLNGADMAQRRGAYPAPAGVPADIPGLELAGEVVALGPGVTRFSTGERIMAVVAGGGQAELAIVPEREAMPVPAPVGWVEAGGLPEAFTTAHDALFSQAQLAAGERLLVTGAAGGVGTAAVQLGVTTGARVVATVRDPERRPAVADLGATVLEPAGSAEAGPYDVIIELVGGPNMVQNLASLATGGRITVIGVGAGATAAIDLSMLMGRRGRLQGSTLRSRPPEDKARAARAVEAHVLPLFDAGRLRVPIHASFALDDVEEAYDRFTAGHKFGKIVLTMD
jgi:putative PIG3 family NAD(P)H quinone oxidoreductase